MNHRFHDLAVLGSGTGLFVPRYWSGFVLDGEVLLDVPPTVGIHLRRLDLRSDTLTCAFVTHLHADHVFGLVFLALEFNFERRRPVPLDVVGPAGIQEHVKRLYDLSYPRPEEAIPTREFPLGLRFHELRGRADGNVGALAYQAIPLKHHPRLLNSFGFRLTRGGHTIAYSGDTTMVPDVLELARGADVFIVECTNHSGAHGDHLDLEAIHTLRRLLPASTRILVTHYQHITQDHLPPGATLVHDFDTIRL